MRRILALCLMLCWVQLGVTPTAFADDPDVIGDPYAPGVHAEAGKTIPGSKSESSAAPDRKATGSRATPAGAGPKVQYRWQPACSSGQRSGDFTYCAAARNCPAGQTRWSLYARASGDPVWQAVSASCYAGRPPTPTGPGGAAPPPRPVVTPALVLREVKRIGLPSLKIQIQPANTTLVNFDTIFYASPPSFARSVDLLDYDVDIEARPTRYTWHTGDGATMSTTGAGGPYPSKEIVHRYRKPGTTVAPSVDVTYRVRFRVDGGAWRDVGQSLTANGQSTTLQIKEATPVLTR